MADISIPKGGGSMHTPPRQSVGSAGSGNQASTHFKAALSAATRKQTEPAPGGPAAIREYTVRPGDTLSEIVATQLKQLGTAYSRRELYETVNQVAAANGLTDLNRIFPGQKIDLACVDQAGSTRSATGAQNSDRLDLPRGFQPPANGKITSLFGIRNHPLLGLEQQHAGIDIGLPTGTPIKPVASGVVAFAGEMNGYGQMVEIDHGNGISSRYAHLSELLVAAGEEISTAHNLGRSGRTGLSTGPHLHLEILRHNRPIDPLALLSRREIEAGSYLAQARRPEEN